MFDDDDQRRYFVAVNDEEQYSIWPLEQPLPSGWRDGGFTGTKTGCLAHINAVWTDMRPRSLREHDAASLSLD